MSKVMHSESAKEIFLWRLSRAVLWSVLMQVFFLCVYICLLNINIVHPLLWFKQTFSLLTTVKTWLYLLPLGSIIFAQGVVCSKEYINEPPSYTTRFSFILHLFSIHNIVLCTLHMISGGLTVWLYLTLLGGKYSNLLKPCATSERSCLVEGNVFLFFSGVWNGFVYFLNGHIFRPSLVTFPPIQQRKFIQVKSSLTQLLYRAMGDSFTPILSFTFLYYLKGYIMRDSILRLFNLGIEDDTLDKLWSVLPSYLLFYAWLFSTLFLTTMHSMTLLFNVHLTEHNHFPIESAMNVTTLCDALSQSPEILTKLAAQDLEEMACKDKARRMQVFSLSIPGGHPTNWTNLSTQCLTIIDNFTTRLNTISGDTKTTENLNKHNNNRSPEHVYHPIMRNLALTSPKMPQPEKITACKKAEKSLMSKIKNTFYLFLQALSKKPGISFFFGELTEMKLKWIVFRGQLVARVAQGLSHLAAASINEDTFGVVQDDLHLIITALLHLKQALDKLTKSGVVNKKSRQDMVVMQMLAELKSAVKRSIYKITVTFGDYMRDIPLDGETHQALQPFINMREG